MIKMMTKNWWLFALRGLFAVIFGVLAFIWPLTTIGALVLLFGVYAIADGGINIVAGFTDPDYRWWVGLLAGLIGIGAGVAAFVWPELTALAFVFIVAAWAFLTGVMEITAAVRLRRELTGEWLLALSGIASIVFAILLVVWPNIGLFTIVWLVGAYAIFFGLLTMVLAYRLRQYRQEIEAEEDEGLGIRPTSA